MADRRDDEATDARGTQRLSRQQLTAAGVAVGVGSAALVAALLFATREGNKEPAKSTHPDCPE